MIRFGVIKEGKIPSDERVPLIPEQVSEINRKYSGKLIFEVQKSVKRRILDSEYINH